MFIKRLNLAKLKEKLIRVGKIGAYLLLGLIVFAMFLHVSRFNGYRRVYFSDMIFGSAWKPFVYRLLLPQTARLISSPIPASTKILINDTVDGIPFFHQIFYTIGWEKEYLTEYIIAAALMFLCLLGFGWALQYLFTGIWNSPGWLVDLIPFIGLLLLPPLFSYTYIYDFSSLFLFTLGLAYLVRKKWISYLMVFIAGCLNKETILLLILIFLFYYIKDKNLGKGNFGRLLTFQLIIFFAIRLLLQWIFRSNQGSPFEYHLVDHNLPLLYQLIKPYSFILIIPILIFCFIFIYRWSSQPRFLKISLFCLVPPLLILSFFFGFLEEWRDYYEAYPVILLILTYSICHITGVRLESRSNPLPDSY